MSRRIDLTGQRFGRWTVLGYVGCRHSRSARWRCVCDCGAENVVQSKHLRNGGSLKCRACDHRQRRGAGTYNYKGGHRATGGYVIVRVPPDDPMFCMCRRKTNERTGAVLEHRLVERHESVHHINGDRADNRIENLQLRTGKHGSGIVMRCMDCGSHRVECAKIAG